MRDRDFTRQGGQEVVGSRGSALPQPCKALAWEVVFSLESDVPLSTSSHFSKFGHYSVGTGTPKA